MSMIRGFAPIENPECRVLILGSMPSVASLNKCEYYGHPRNAFWPLVSALLDEPYRENYDARKQMLLKHHIALWDVVAACEREGSSDAAITNVTVNDFPAFFAAHHGLKHVFFNGGKSYALFKKHIGYGFDGIGYHQLGSTSPAHAVSFEQRLSDWGKLTLFLKGENQA